MSHPFSIVEVLIDAADAEEAMGTKFKFWFKHLEKGYYLFKQARPNTGEDWAEKLAAEFAELLGLPHAEYELAIWNGKPGVISPLMVPNSTLIHGNDILAGLNSDYPRDQDYGVSQHTLEIVLNAIADSRVKLPLNWEAPAGITTAVDTFVGYLLLDAWIGNGDRHHENWGFIETLDQSVHLAPSYDHASSLGRELLDSKRQEYIENKSVKGYVGRARSAFYQQPEDRKPLPTIEAFSTVAKRYPHAASIWLEQLANLSFVQIKQLLTCLPSHRFSPLALEFVWQILHINHSRLLSLREELS
ncbi:MAG: HipA domain-containing protein [Desertifilum sp.]|nr:HipA domain-containing protein [Desertifilum sp.]